MRSKYLRIALLITIMATLLFTKQAVADSTSTYELSSSSGVWTSVDGGGDTVTGVGSTEIRWGGASQQGGQKSGLSFDGAGSQTFSEGEIFLLGTLTHMNWPVYEPVATGATLQITLQFSSPDLDSNPQFTFSFEIDETTNWDNQSQCAAWHTDGNPPCDDMITFPTAYGQESFQIGDKLYTLKIVGFVDEYPNGDVVQQFITREQADNVAYLVGTLSSVLVSEPDITVTKKTNDTDVDSAPGPYLTVGDEVTWQYIVQNTGNVDLTNITVVDDQEGVVTCPQTSLEAGELMTCTAITGTVESGQYTNTVTATGTPTSGCCSVSDTDTSYYYGLNSGLSLIKSADKDTFSAVGETITYTFSVENTGDTTLTDVVINDALTGSVDLAVTPSTLAPGEFGTATATYITTQADIDAGQILNTATATGTDPSGGTVEDQDDESVDGPGMNPSIELVKEVSSINGDPSVTEYSQIGDEIAYSFTVTNNGNVTLSNVTLNDPDASVSGGPIASLAPGESDSTTFTATYTVTQADLDVGSFTNTATASGEPPSGSPVTDDDSTTTEGSKTGASINLIKEVVSVNGDPSITEYSQVGDEIAYIFTVTNDGNVTLSNVTLDDPDTSVSGGPISSLAPGEVDSTTFTATYTITQDDINADSFTNTATATGNPPYGDPVSDSDDATISGPGSSPSITVNKVVSAINGDPSVTVFSQVGDEITYSFTVTNNGNVTLTNVTLDDPDASVSGGPIASMSPGEVDSTTFTATYTITQADINAGSFTNTATATGNPPSGDPVSDSDAATVPGPESSPSIVLEKTVSAINGDPSITEYSQVGDVITYSFTVTNNGNVTLSNVTVDDPDASVSGGPIASMAPGESDSTAFSATYAITQADLDAGSFNNTATATGNPPSGSAVSDDDSAIVEGPKSGASIELIKEVASINGEPSITEFSQAGDEITYNFTVTNDGNMTLSNVTVDDPDASVSGGPIASLAPGASDSTTFTATYIVTQADVNAGSFTNTATATGNPSFGDPVSDSDDATVSGPEASPSIIVNKVVSEINGDPSITEYSQVGDEITYSFTITNNGNVTLTNVTLDDPDASVSGGPIASMAPGEVDSTTFSATYIITQADVDAGSFTNTATVTGNPPSGDPVSDSDAATVSGPDSSPSIIMNKVVSAINGDPSVTEYSQVGDVITYSFTVTNNGNVTLSNVTLDDPDASVSGGPIASLAPGESDSTTFSATYAVTQADLDAGSFTNIATATGNPPTGDAVSDNDSATAEGSKTGASIELIKTVASVNGDPSVTEYSQVGDEIAYSFTVTNDGNVTLSNVTLDDPDASVSGGPISSLAPGESDSTTFTATYVVTQADIDAGSFTNTATTTGTPPFGDPVSASDTEIVDGPKSGASINLVKEIVNINGDPSITQYSQVGDVINYSFTITNDGLFTLTNITLSDPDTDVTGDPIASLAPGESDSTTFTASYTVTQADINAGSFTNTAVASGNPPSGDPVSDSDDATAPGPEASPSIFLEKSVSAINDDPSITEFSQVGDVITYSFTVTNNGNVTLSNVTLDDPEALVSGGPIASLAPGEVDSTTFTATYVVTQADIDAGTFDNTATAYGNPPSGDPVSDDDDAVVSGPKSSPSIVLTKSISAINDDPSITEFTQVGDVISYDFTVTNDGNVTLYNVTVDDPDATIHGGSIASLAPGESDSTTFTATYVVTQSDIDAGIFTNYATVTGNPPSGDPVTDDDDAETTGPEDEPAISMVKEVTAINGNPSTTEFSQVGDVITYSFTVTNEGNVTLSNVTIDDPDASVSGGPIASLAPGESDSTTFTATYAITQDDIDAGTFTNTATASGEPPSGDPVTDDDSATVEGPTSGASINLVKEVSAINDDPSITVFSQAGDVITYSFTVTNDGLFTLTNVTLDDPDASVSGGPIDSLAPGESDSTTFTATYTITQDDMDASYFTNTATVTGYPPAGSAVTDYDTVTVDGPKTGASISLVKNVAAVNDDPSVTEYSQVGDVITYSFIVTNNGNVTLSNVTLDDPDASVSGGPISSLAPDESDSTTFTATYTITQDDIDAGSFTNTATATGEPPYGDSVSDDDSATAEGPKSVASIDLEKEIIYLNGDPSITGYSQVGDIITYSFTITNDGLFTLTNITLSDPDTDVSGGPIASLAPGESDSTTFTATYTVTQEDIDAGSFTNTAVASGNPPSGDPVSDSDDATASGPEASPSIVLEKSVSAINDDPSITEFSQVGDVITYSFTVTNNGNVTLSNVTLDDPEALVSGGPIASLAPGESDSTTFTATYVVTQADIDAGTFDNTATATGEPPSGDSVSDEDDAVVSGPKSSPSITLTKSISAINDDPSITEFTQVGDVISYDFTVTNDGNVTLYNVTVDDPDATIHGGSIASLAPGESDSTTFTATYVITQADIDAGTFTNSATATGNPPSGDPVTDDDDAETTGPEDAPAISVVKEVTAINGESSITEFSQVGDVITYSFTVTNEGNVTLSNVTIDDPDASVSGGPIASLAPGESDSTTFTAMYIITQADIDAGSFANTATASGEPPSGDPVTDDDSATVEGPKSGASITLLKEVSAINGDPSVTVFSQAGDVITYSFTVTNDGLFTLTNVTISDPVASVSGGPIASLAPGESDSTTFTATYTITQADVDAGAFSNTATVTGNPLSGDPVTDDDDASVEGPKSGASIQLDKVADVSSYDEAGDVITYTFTATNDGILTLTNVHIEDPMTGLSELSCSPTQPTTLGPGESIVCTATYTVTLSDITNGQVENTATATGTDPYDDPVEDTDDETVDGPELNPDITLTKTANPSVYTSVSDVITYTFSVENTGNVTLTDIVIDDPLTGSVNLQVTPSTLAPGETGVATATYTITQDDVDSGKVVNTATATGKDPNGDSVSDDDGETVEGPKQGPDITLEKTADTSVFTSVGEVITYTFTVTNTGNVTLTDVEIDDPLTGTVNLAVSPSTLAPNETGIASATYTITQDDVNEGEVVNTATATGKDPNGDSVEDEDEETVEGPKQGPDITLQKTADSDVYTYVGEIITYTFTVTNTGNVTLTDVEIDDPLTGTVNLAVSPSTLAPSESGTASATYTITQDDIDEGEVVNTATATGKDPDGDSVEDEDKETIEGPKDSPDITLVKTGYPQTYSEVGEIITYTFTVTNTGNVTLTDVVIDDALTESVNLAVSPSTLDPGESGTATATYTITQDDIDNGYVTNTATATGTSDETEYTDTDQETVTLEKDPTPDKPSGGDEMSPFMEKIVEWICKLGIQFEFCE